MSILAFKQVLLAVAAIHYAAAASVGHKNTEKYIASCLTRGELLDAYYAELTVGTPPQKERLLVDTGSPTFSFEDSRNPWCESSGKPCSYFGTFDNLTSSTSRYAGPSFFDELADFGSGEFLRDTVGIGGVRTKDMFFGYISNYPFTDQIRDPTATILGLGLNCNKGVCGESGPYFLPQLKKASAIDRMIVSMYLGPDEIDSGAEMILGGVYDKAKVDGQMFTVPMVDPSSTAANLGTNVLNVTAISSHINGHVAKETYGSGSYAEGIPTILDTGNSNWGLPSAVFNATIAQFGKYTMNPKNGVYMVDCKYRDPKQTSGHITVEFGKAGSIQVPLYALITEFRDGTCGTYIENGFDDGPNLGDPFIRSTYAVWDQETYRITLAQAKYTTAREIVAIPAGGFPLTHH